MLFPSGEFFEVPWTSQERAALRCPGCTGTPTRSRPPWGRPWAFATPSIRDSPLAACRGCRVQVEVTVDSEPLYFILRRWFATESDILSVVNDIVIRVLAIRSDLCVRFAHILREFNPTSDALSLLDVEGAGPLSLEDLGRPLGQRLL